MFFFFFTAVWYNKIVFFTNVTCDKIWSAHYRSNSQIIIFHECFEILIEFIWWGKLFLFTVRFISIWRTRRSISVTFLHLFLRAHPLYSHMSSSPSYPSYMYSVTSKSILQSQSLRFRRKTRSIFFPTRKNDFDSRRQISIIYIENDENTIPDVSCAT